MPRTRTALLLLLVAVFAAACGGRTGSSGATGTPSPTGSSLPVVELKLRVVDAVGGAIDWCDPDIYPVGRGTELQRARQALDEMQANPDVYDAVLGHEGIDPDAELTDRQLVRVYGDYKLVANDTPVPLVPDGDGYRFTLIVYAQQAGYDDKVEGRVTDDGTVTIERTIPGDGSPGHFFNPNCPICLARGTRIASPHGFVGVEDVRVGMPVWSTDRSGDRISAVVIAVGHTPVPPTHRVVRLALADGRRVLVSPGHPTPDGGTVGGLRIGDPFEGTRIVSVERIPYGGGFTYDLLPSGPTGTYFANGVVLGSTLARATARSA